MRPLTIVWSSRAGMSFAGGGGFTVTQYTALHSGQVTMHALRPAIPSSSDTGHPPDPIVEAGASFDASIGPVWASGNSARLIDFGVGSTPLNGVGGSIETAGLIGRRPRGEVPFAEIGDMLINVV